jgi:hypothetical protein
VYIRFFTRKGLVPHIVLILILLGGIGEIGYAQEFSAGFNAGGGLSYVSYSRKEYKNQFNPEMKPTFKGGLSLNIPLTNSFEVYSEFNYALRGRKVQAVENEWVMNEKHHYLELPLMFNIKRTGEIKKIGPFKQVGPFTWIIGAGPNISYFLGGSGTLETYARQTDYKISFEGHEGDYHYITFNPVNRWQWGLDIHLGLLSPLANGKELLTSLKFTWGHTNLGSFDGSNMPILGFTDNIAHNYKILTLSFSYLFQIDLREFYKGKSTKGEKVKAKAIHSGPTKKGNNINKINKKK